MTRGVPFEVPLKLESELIASFLCNCCVNLCIRASIDDCCLDSGFGTLEFLVSCVTIRN